MQNLRVDTKTFKISTIVPERCVLMWGHKAVDIVVQDEVKKLLGHRYVILWHGKIERFVLYYRYPENMLHKIKILCGENGEYRELGSWVIDRIKGAMTMHASKESTPEKAVKVKNDEMDEANEKWIDEKYFKSVRDMDLEWKKDLESFQSKRLFTTGVPVRKVSA